MIQKLKSYGNLGETNKAIIIINESIDLDPENQYYQNQKNKFLNSIN